MVRRSAPACATSCGPQQFLDNGDQTFHVRGCSFKSRTSIMLPFAPANVPPKTKSCPSCTVAPSPECTYVILGPGCHAHSRMSKISTVLEPPAKDELVPPATITRQSCDTTPAWE